METSQAGPCNISTWSAESNPSQAASHLEPPKLRAPDRPPELRAALKLLPPTRLPLRAASAGSTMPKACRQDAPHALM